jgi:hypothetical protein
VRAGPRARKVLVARFEDKVNFCRFGSLIGASDGFFYPAAVFFSGLSQSPGRGLQTSFLAVPEKQKTCRVQVWGPGERRPEAVNMYYIPAVNKLLMNAVCHLTEASSKLERGFLDMKELGRTPPDSEVLMYSQTSIIEAFLVEGQVSSLRLLPYHL